MYTFQNKKKRKGKIKKKKASQYLKEDTRISLKKKDRLKRCKIKGNAEKIKMKNHRQTNQELFTMNRSKGRDFFIHLQQLLNFRILSFHYILLV
jgi:hypothetical protein